MEKRQGGFTMHSGMWVSTSVLLRAALCWLVTAVVVLPAFGQTNYAEKYRHVSVTYWNYTNVKKSRAQLLGITRERLRCVRGNPRPPHRHSESVSWTIAQSASMFESNNKACWHRTDLDCVRHIFCMFFLPA